MAERPPSSSIKPMVSKPEALSAPPKGDDVETGKTPSDRTTVSAKTSSGQSPSATFANTKQHVADRQKTFETTERFTNTKHNIALINDPKNGPRFTLTKKESGHVEKPASKTGPLAVDKPDAAEKPDGGATSKAEPPRGADAKEKALDASILPEANAAAANGTAAGEAGVRDTRQAASAPAQKPVGQLGVPPAAVPPSKVPIDSSKTFVGTNGTYYDEAWRWMDWRGTKRSWNWPACASFGHWFAYRRLYRYAGLAAGWLILLAAALVNNLHVGIVAGLFVIGLILVGQYANILYFQVFRRSVADVTENGEGSYEELRQQLAAAGGTNPKAPFYMAGATFLGIGLALGLTYYLRGGFLFNIWPF